IANSWDAGADMVEIVWPENHGDLFSISDNGTGMTFDEFRHRWLHLKYNRKHEQGDDVEFPLDNMNSSRKAFGRNGKGRHAMFCFSDSYVVKTTKDGTNSVFEVRKAFDSSAPFLVYPAGQVGERGHGTSISANLYLNYLTIQDVRELIGSKFISDPAFRISVNGELVELTDVKDLTKIHILTIENFGEVLIRHIQSDVGGRTSKQNGVAWWVQKRLVGEPSWRGFDDIPYLDARRAQARRHTFIVEADLLVNSVKEDWSDFKETSEFETVQIAVKDFIGSELGKLMQDVYRERKEAAITANQKEIKELSPSSRYMLGTFLDEIQRTLPTIGERELSATVDVLSKLEKSRSGFMLLEQLANLSPDDLDGLSQLLSTWTVQEATIVLDELGRRLKLIEKLEEIVDNPSTDELHGLQPLFGVGLWIFGPEYEGVSFTSNKTLLTVVEKYFQDDLVMPLHNPKKRPDFVTLPNSSVSLYSRDSHDERGEVDGVEKILLVELKRGGFELTRKEIWQATEYANELRKSGKIQNKTEIIGFVLGSTVASDAREPHKEGDRDQTKIFIRTYSTVILQAHARTFNLLKKIKDIAKDTQLFDADVERIINQPSQMEM
ncbi:MAG: ATP-binding protein, partial [Anaerolineae bacterium]|nr:ATP-binding protein [Anaerolineae bacterium]